MRPSWVLLAAIVVACSSTGTPNGATQMGPSPVAQAASGGVVEPGSTAGQSMGGMPMATGAAISGGTGAVSGAGAAPTGSMGGTSSLSTAGADTAGQGTAGMMGAVGGRAGAGGSGGAQGGSGGAQGGSGGAQGGMAGASGAGGAGAASGPCAPQTEYTNLLSTILGMTEAEVDAKVEAGFQQLFHGGSGENVYYQSGDEGYILDVASNDVRSEGQSYGMMIALQLDKKEEFDAIWRWSQRVMQQPDGRFGWHASTGGQLISNGSAPDGEEYFATALIWASRHWGDDTGIDYMAEAQRVLAAMYDEDLFDHDEQLVKFVQSSNYTDPSYILPAFYEVWACVDEDAERAAFWKAAADVGREFFPKTVDAGTGLAPYLANFDGSARDIFNSDSYRVVGNIMMDYYMFGVDPWQVTFAETYANFFEANQQSSNPGAEFRLDGTPTVSYGRPEAALAAMNATVAFAAPEAQGRYFLQYLWDMDIPSGQYRYYAGMLYMLSILHVSGKFRMY